MDSAPTEPAAGRARRGALAAAGAWGALAGMVLSRWMLVGSAKAWNRAVRSS